ncbi:transglutaminase domain-containing protein [Mesorhizobium sp. ES1-1]|uniref:transglutaminase domain-containing protein n=1 Tax=Mesorhizobium sp. ES1-1 TaxID=2876629 RepID=UPI00398D041E
MNITETLFAIKADVDSRIVYDNTDTLRQLPDYTWVTAGSHGRGDCTCFAQTYMEECRLVGLDASTFVYRLDDGQWHCVCNVMVDGETWALDCRVKYPERR